MSIKQLKISNEFKTTLRSSKNTSFIITNEMENPNAYEPIFKKKLPIEIPNKFQMKVFKNNPLYAKSKVINHLVHDRHNPNKYLYTSKTLKKNTPACAAKGNNIGSNMISVK